MGKWLLDNSHQRQIWIENQIRTKNKLFLKFGRNYFIHLPDYLISNSAKPNLFSEFFFSWGNKIPVNIPKANSRIIFDATHLNRPCP